jgi:hypothetical protein
MPTTRVELKYCEGCGALCFRSAADDAIYCSECERKLALIPKSAEPDRKRRQV